MREMGMAYSSIKSSKDAILFTGMIGSVRVSKDALLDIHILERECEAPQALPIRVSTSCMKLTS